MAAPTVMPNTSPILHEGGPSPKHSPILREGELPPLEFGDRLTRDEFERRYDAMPNLKKAELLEGVVFMPSPVRQRRHSQPHIRLGRWLVIYEAATPGVEAGDNATVRLDDENEPQPDALLFINQARGGQARIDDDDYIAGAPELAAEVTASSVSYDLHTKLNVYRRFGVREYVVWRVLNGAIDWYVLRQGQYEQLAPDAQGILKSEVFPGLWLDPAALVGGDLARVLAVVQQGIASPEHAAFVARLTAAGPRP
jgi:Uma2 family endonuclease